MLNEQTIAMMKSNATIINTARGKLINESALYHALKEKRISAASLDVHYEEPISTDNHLLSTLDNVILTPHIGGLSFETFQTMMKDAIENIVAFDKQNLQSIENKILKL